MVEITLRRRTEISDGVIEIVSRHFGLEESSVSESTHFDNDLNADGLDIIEIVADLEKEFEINLNDAECEPERVQTVGQVIDLVISREAKK